jgi:hypothetical protein
MTAVADYISLAINRDWQWQWRNQYRSLFISSTACQDFPSMLYCIVRHETIMLFLAKSHRIS